MKKRFGKYMKIELLRPSLYKLFTRLGIGAAVMVVWQIFCNSENLRSPLRWVSPLLFMIFIAGAWFLFLKFDGFKLPKLFNRNKDSGEKKKKRGDISDDLDTDINNFEELQSDERDFCSMMSNLTAALIFLVLSFF